MSDIPYGIDLANYKLDWALEESLRYYLWSRLLSRSIKILWHISTRTMFIQKDLNVAWDERLQRQKNTSCK